VRSCSDRALPAARRSRASAPTRWMADCSFVQVMVGTSALVSGRLCAFGLALTSSR
jgi:hypothetical protein